MAPALTNVSIDERLIAAYYACFNERRFTDAVQLFAADATVEHIPLVRPQRRGPAAYVAFAEHWTRAFPDAVIAVQRVTPRTDSMLEVDLLARGSHQGALIIGPGLAFKPAGVTAIVRLRELLEIRDGKIVFASLSLDVQDVISQLVTVDYKALAAHLARIRRLSDELSAAAADAETRNDLTTRLGLELDAARQVIRPYYAR
jgi:hypothetical protein